MEPQDICRTCLYTGRTMFPLYEAEEPRRIASGTATVVNLLEVWNEILISRDDGFPGQICTRCLDEIERSYAFKLKCKSSEATLMKLKDAQMELKRLQAVSFRIDHETEDLADGVCIKNEIIDEDDEPILPFDKSHEDNLSNEPFHETGLDMDEDMIENMEKELFNPRNNSQLADVFIKPENDLDNGFDYAARAVSKSLQRNAVRRAKRRQRYYAQTQREPRPYITDNEFQCRACTNVYSKIELLRKHLVESHTEGLMCFICNKEFQYDDMWKHCLSHLPTKHKCTVCGKGFIKRGYLKAHFKHTHENFHRETFHCKLCSKEFKTRSGISYHRQVAHTIEKAYKCEICGKRFPHIKLLKIHMIGAHTNEPPHKCKFCSFGFKSKQGMLKHIRKYHNNKNERALRNLYKCILCTKEFAEKRSLNVHVLTVHTNNRPYKCTHCPFAFKFQATMITHIDKYHGNENNTELLLQMNFLKKCEVCSKTFRSKTNLLAHISQSHANERPYQCSFCSYTFKQENRLAVHLNTIHNDRLGTIYFICNECDDVFYSEESLIEHKTKEHAERFDLNTGDSMNSTDFILRTMFD